jgi:hypothetical protein
VRVTFLYSEDRPQDALPNWVLQIGRHCQKHYLQVAYSISQALEQQPDCVFPLTQLTYTPDVITDHLRDLRERGIPHGVVHNEDWGIPTPGRYPSFCWNQTAANHLFSYAPLWLVHPPVLPLKVEPQPRRLHLGTFALCEPKKSILEIARWAKKFGIPLTVFRPDIPEITNRYQEYARKVVEAGAKVITYEWQDDVTWLADLFEDHGISHFIFDVTRSKGSTGGSPTSPCYAAAFGRPIVVIDDEPHYRTYNYTVFRSLAEMTDPIRDLLAATLPQHDWSPDAYIDFLLDKTFDFWRAKE